MKSLLSTCSFALLLSPPLIAQQLSSDQAEFVSNHFMNLNADANYQNANWEPVLDAVGNKRIVLLGEFNHGSKEVFTSRNELIRLLYEQLGFDLILFESGLGELEVINLKKRDLKSTELTAGFFGPWRTKEFEDLMDYIRQNDIQISGFDVQRTGGTFTNYLSEKMGDETFKNAEREFGVLSSQLSNYKTVYDSIKTPTLQLIKKYEEIENKLDLDDQFSKRAIQNRIIFLTYMMDFIKTKDWTRRWEERDRAMADNIKWILSSKELDQKAIVIAHNFHISKYNERENVMGEFLIKDYEEEMYAIGVYAGGGTFVNNYGKPEELIPPSDKGLDIKHLIAADRGNLTFLNISVHASEPDHWLQEPIIVNDTFIDLSNSNKLILGKCFDGLLLFDSITPTEKRD